MVICLFKNLIFMIVILSEKTDYSTFEVMQWLNNFNIEFVRINSTDQIHLMEIDLNKNTFIVRINEIIIDIFQVSMIWHRRGMFRFSLKSTTDQISIIQKQEDHVINHYIFESFLLDNKNVIGNYLFSNPNKLLVLRFARKIGLDIPDTFISGNKKKILNFISNKSKVITKGLGNPITYREGGSLYKSYTEELTSPDLVQFDDNFFPSLLQNRIEKKFEIRTFFLIDKFYSMAIFSQQNSKTAVDFRKYDSLLPNRTIPFKLPKKVERKLVLLLKKLKLNTASIDIIVNDKGKYIFLEVNPVGQFGMVSKPCNYFLEKKLAKKLAKNEI